MNRFNSFMNSHFQGSGCRLIANAFDTSRNRKVSLHAMPGYWDVVGVSDGVDAWIAPASAGLFFHTATGDCADLLRRLKAGEELGPVPEARLPKARVVVDEDDPRPRPAKRTRVALEDDDEPVVRRSSHGRA